MNEPRSNNKNREHLNGAQEVRRSTQVQGCSFGEHGLREEQTCSLVTFFARAKKVTRSRSE
jgi:hypothetical protein